MLRWILVTLLACSGLAAQIVAFVPRSQVTSSIPVAMDYTFPAGTTYWTNPLVIEGQVGMAVKGQRGNRGPSRMIYRGPPIAAPIQFVGCTRCSLLDLEVVDESGCAATVLVTNAVNPGESGFSTANVFRNVRVLHGTKGSKRAFSIDSRAVGGVDGNNDHHQFVNCLAQSYTEAGFYVNGSQCHDLIFTGCAALDYGGRKPVGFHFAEGVFATMRDTAFNSNSTDILCGAAETQLVVDGANSENSQRFFVFTNASGMLSTNIANVQWRGKPVAGRPVVDVAGNGSSSLRNVSLAGLEGVCPTMRFVNGGADLAGVTLRQHGGTMPTGAIVTAGTAWESRAFGMKWNIVPVVGPQVTKAIALNKVLPGAF